VGRGSGCLVVDFPAAEGAFMAAMVVEKLGFTFLGWRWQYEHKLKCIV